MRTIVKKGIWLITGVFLILIWFDASLAVPGWLQPLGRLHPMILHFPIVFVLALAALSFFRKIPTTPQVYQDVVILTIAISLVTSIMGLVLANETGSSNTLSWHKWSAGLMIVTLVVFMQFGHGTLANKLSAVALMVCVIVTGHFGATITHGENFILEPVTAREELPQTVFGAHIYPVLEQKCVGCHNDTKTKGGLNMTSYKQMVAGGKSGPLWLEGLSDSSLMIQRISLPKDHDDHMPPPGRTQITDHEQLLLQTWIDEGADVTILFADLSDESRLASLISLIPEDEQVVEFADPEEVQKLNSSFRYIGQLAPHEAGLGVNFFVAARFEPQMLDELKPVAEFVEAIDLSYMPITDEQLSRLLIFPNLRRLILNFTSVTGNGLEQLVAMQNLNTLGVAGTSVSSNHVTGFENIQIYAWNSEIDSSAITTTRQIDFGYRVEDEDPIQLTPPVLVSNSRIIEDDEKVALEHPVTGAQILYSVSTGSEPEVYTAPIVFEEVVSIRASAQKEGWLPSDTVEFQLIKKGLKPDSVRLLTNPDPKYKGSFHRSLFDAELAQPGDVGAAEWLGYRGKNVEIGLDLGDLRPEKIKISWGVIMYAHIFPPKEVEVWESSDGLDFVRTASFKMKAEPEYLAPFTDLFENDIQVNKQYLKIVLVPRKLPDWHDGKGKDAWVFIDELFLF